MQLIILLVVLLPSYTPVLVVMLRYYPMVEVSECDQPSSAVMEASELSSVITKTGSV